MFPHRIEAKQVANDIAVLSAVETAQGHTAGLRMSIGGIDLFFQPRDQVHHHLAVRAFGARRRHEAAPQLTYCGFPGFRIIGNPIRGQRIQSQPADTGFAIVAAETVAFDRSTVPVRDRFAPQPQ